MWLSGARLRGVNGIEASRHRLFLMFRAATEHRVEAQAEERGDHRKDDDLKYHW